jgi:hypothetical protein
VWRPWFDFTNRDNKYSGMNTELGVRDPVSEP